jgi:hypothetical protein
MFRIIGAIMFLIAGLVFMHKLFVLVMEDKNDVFSLELLLMCGLLFTIIGVKMDKEK